MHMKGAHSKFFYWLGRSFRIISGIRRLVRRKAQTAILPVMWIQNTMCLVIRPNRQEVPSCWKH